MARGEETHASPAARGRAGHTGARQVGWPRVAAHGVYLLLAAAIMLRAAQEPRNDFRFSILGDRTGGAQKGVFERVWREVDLLHPDFVVNVGDMIEGKKDETAAAEWDALAPIWRRYEHFPLYFTPGNHDIWSPRSEEIYREKTGAQPFYSFNYEDAHFVVLDNSRTEKPSDAQLDFLEADLQRNAERDPTFVIFHRPFWIPYVMLKDTSQRLHQVCKRGGVDWVISGHGHQLVSLPFDGVHYLEIGSSGGELFGLRRGEGFDKGWFYHHAWVRVKRGQVQVTIKELDGGRGKGRMFLLDQWQGTKPLFSPEDPGGVLEPGG